MRNKIIILLFIFIFSLMSCSGEEVSSDSDTEVKEYNHHVSSFSVSGEKLSIFDPASEIDSTQGTIVIAVKPQVVENVLITLRGKLTSETTIISIVAGYSTKDIRNYIGKAPKLIRTMPNTPAAIGKGMTAIFSDSALDQNIRSEAEALFSAIGKYCWIEDEDHMHLITAVSGSGPAYYYLLTECLIEIASSCGLEKNTAALLVEQTFTGSAALAETFSSISPTQHRQNVTSPGGTTEAALKILMEDDKLKGLLDLAINSAVERSKNLSK